LPQVSLIPVAVLVANLLPASMTLAVLVVNLPPVSLIAEVHLDLQYHRKFLKKFEMTPTLLSEAWGKMIHKKPEAKNLVALSL
jgi:hypothetical protein